MSLSSSSTALPLAREPAVSESLLKHELQPTNDSDPANDSDQAPAQRPKLSKRRLIALLTLLAVIVIVVLTVALPVHFLVIKRHQSNSSGSGSSSSSSSSGSGSGSGTGTGTGTSGSGTPTSGGDGSRVVTENGTVFTYHNPFGGYWVQDPQNPFNDNARPNSWTPPLNTSWRWGTDRIYGVNLGGWLVIEPFITPQLFQKYTSARDERDLSVAMANDTGDGGGISQLEKHYDTFISEQDIAEMAGAGLNFIRVPIPFWAVETWEGEPFLARTSWKYFLRFLGWARKYGMRVCLDLHTVPGSQNGYNHSGWFGPINFLSRNMGLANAERTMYYLRVLTEFISQPQYRNLVTIFGIINEPLTSVIGMDSITSFYLKAHDMMRSITGYGEGNGPYIAIHDGFSGTKAWAGFLQGSDRIMMDKHNYFSFGGSQTDPLDVEGANGLLGGIWTSTACNAWGPSTNASRESFGVTFVGEFAASPNDCGLFLRGAQANPQTSNCSAYDDWENYSSDMIHGIKNFVMASMDAFGDWFFWTWKIAAAKSGNIETPLWSYQLGYRNGWIPSDPRKAVGMCKSVDYSPSTWVGTFQPWQTGTTSSIPAISSSEYPWPPLTVSNAIVPVSLMPTYTDTATVVTMPVPTFTSIPPSVTQSFDGWFDKADTSGGVTTVAGCSYPYEYNGSFDIIPTAPCTGPTGGVAATPTATQTS